MVKRVLTKIYSYVLFIVPSLRLYYAAFRKVAYVSKTSFYATTFSSMKSNTQKSAYCISINKFKSIMIKRFIMNIYNLHTKYGLVGLSRPLHSTAVDTLGCAKDSTKQ